MSGTVSYLRRRSAAAKSNASVSGRSISSAGVGEATNGAGQP